MEIPPESLQTDPVTGAETVYYQVNVDRGVDWEASQRLHEAALSETDAEVAVLGQGDGPLAAEKNSWLHRRHRRGVKTGYFVTIHPFHNRHFVLLAMEKPVEHQVRQTSSSSCPDCCQPQCVFPCRCFFRTSHTVLRRQYCTFVIPRHQ